MRCRCGKRGYRYERTARAVHHHMTHHLGLTRAPDFYQCGHGLWHWPTKA